MKKANRINLSVPPTSYSRILRLAEDAGCITGTGNLNAAEAIRRTMRVVLDFHHNEDFRKQVEQEGGDTLSYIQKCVRKELRKAKDEDK